MSTTWFSGPDFLNKKDNDWPKTAEIVIELPLEEMRKVSLKTTKPDELLSSFWIIVNDIQGLIGILRQHLWIINARELVRKVVRSCVKPRLMQQVMGDLPADRFLAQRPFLVSGVDFCGPFQTSYRIRVKPPYKTYVAIFVCFSSKAVHIELLSDLSTN